MDTTLKRYGNRLCFKTRDPAEEPINVTWRTKPAKKHKKKHRISQQAGYELQQQYRHLNSIKREIQKAHTK